jgi:sugar phosphate permease
LRTPQKVSETYFPARGVVVVGVLMSVVGLLLFSPIKLPSMYRFVGGFCFFIMGISIIGSDLLVRVMEFLDTQEQKI